MSDPSVPAAPNDLDPRAQVSALFRWGALIMMSLVVLGVYYAYDSLNPIGEVMKKDLDITAALFGGLKQSAASIPNVILLIIGGVMLDRLGTRLGGGIVAALCALGTLITGLGAMISAFWIMFAGRIVFGAGVETLLVAQNKIIAKWFRGKELSLAFGVNLSLCRLGTFFAFTSMNGLAGAFGWRGALMVVAGIMGVGFVIFIAYAGLDRWIERRVKIAEEKTEEINLRYMLGLPRSFWYIAMLCVTFYCAVFPFMDFAPQIFEARFEMPSQFGSPVTSMVILLTIIFTPLFGHLCDRFGRRATMMVVGSLMLIPIHLSFGFMEGGASQRPSEPLINFFEFQWYEVFPLNTIDIIPILPVMLLGIAFSLVPAAMWPSVARMVEQDRLGTAYALMFLIQNIGLMIMSPVVGWGEKPAFAEGIFGPFQVSALFLAALGTVGLVFAVLLKLADRTAEVSIEAPETS